jgi:hypothetical protein
MVRKWFIMITIAVPVTEQQKCALKSTIMFLTRLNTARAGKETIGSELRK